MATPPGNLWHPPYSNARRLDPRSRSHSPDDLGRPMTPTAAALALLRQHYQNASAWELLNRLAAPQWGIFSTISEVQRLLRKAG